MRLLQNRIVRRKEFGMGLSFNNYAYSARGWLLARTDALGRVTRYVYDNVGRFGRGFLLYMGRRKPTRQRRGNFRSPRPRTGKG